MTRSSFLVSYWADLTISLSLRINQQGYCLTKIYSIMLWHMSSPILSKFSTGKFTVCSTGWEISEVSMEPSQQSAWRLFSYSTSKGKTCSWWLKFSQCQRKTSPSPPTPTPLSDSKRARPSTCKGRRLCEIKSRRTTCSGTVAASYAQTVNFSAQTSASAAAWDRRKGIEFSFRGIVVWRRRFISRI